MRRATLLLATLLALTCAWRTSLAAKTGPLSEKDRRIVKPQVVGSYKRGNSIGLIKALAPLVSRLDPAGIAALNQMLADLDAPPVGQMLAEARLALVDQQRIREAPRLRAAEAALALATIRQPIIDVLLAKYDADVFADPLPAPNRFTDYEALFAELGSFQDRLVQTRQIADFGAAAALAAQNVDRTILSDVQLAALDVDFGEDAASIEELSRELREREMELRIQRLEFAVQLLQDSQARQPDVQTVKTRILAAAVVDGDGAALVEFFKTAAKGGENIEFMRARLNDAQLPQQVRETVEQGRALAGDLVIKGRLFQRGLAWWRRGRYGAGSEMYGLLKPAQALRSQLAQLMVYMPAETIAPTDPFVKSEGQSPNYDRRHHYTWAWPTQRLTQYRNDGIIDDTISHNYRTGRYTRGCNSYGPREIIATDRVTTRTRYTTETAKITRHESEWVKRIVGYTEFLEAIKNLETLVSLCDEMELKAIDELVRERDDLAVYTNLSRRVAPPLNPMTELAQKPNDDFQRRGLDWVLALARVELGAMLAAFTEAKSPFEIAYGNSGYGRSAYAEMLRDGLRMHYWALVNDPIAHREFANRVASTRTLLYSRRLVLARAFLQAAARIGADEYSPVQRQELSAWKDKLEETQAATIVKVAVMMASQSAADQQTIRKSSPGIGQFLGQTPDSVTTSRNVRQRTRIGR